MGQNKRGQYDCGTNKPNGSDLYGLCFVKPITETDLRTMPRARKLKSMGIDYWPCIGPICQYKKPAQETKPIKATLRGSPLCAPPGYT